MRRILLASAFLNPAAILLAAPTWQAGFAKVDATPTEPVRMSGYGNRDHPSDGVDTPLFVRAMALQNGDDSPHVLVSIDNIGLPGSLARELTQSMEQRRKLPRQNIVLASTHTHTGPDLVSELSNIFGVDLTEAEVAAGTRYRKRLSEAILSAVDQALKSLAPAKLAFGSGRATFAANRRLLENGRWSGFGVQPDGPVDHSVPVLRILGDDGKIRGIAFNYACHCTTLDGSYYRINGDWAGYAAADLEATYPEAVALCTIGCGADANPEPRGSRELAELHGRALAKEVKRVASGDMTPVDQPVTAAFSHAGLSFDLPTIEELQRHLNDPSVQRRRHAQHFQKVYERDGRLPATYPVPIQSWRFGDQLTMIFLGGEVVVDYALRLKHELPSQPLWVTAYANDVMGYVASERMRAEGGYEYDESAIYYNLPGPWAAGSEDLLIRRIHELLKRTGPEPPIDPKQALESISVPAEYAVELAAAEPQVEDPINIAFGTDGSLWVVEMGDYPLGIDRETDGGRIKRLTDPDGDGVFDHATVFLEGIEFPTGVHPWRDGVIVIAAPEIFFARDRDGDGKSDERETLFTGLSLANPQHRASGFAYGLDHALYCASGDYLGELTCVRTGEKVNASGHDFRIWPDSGRLETLSGRTQYIRSRNDWGDWFGNENSLPMYHYPIDDRYLLRNRAVTYGDNKQQLFDPPAAPPVYPLTDTDRLNDLFAANRFTSACSATVVRSGLLGDLDGAALVCEPVHNLVHRSKLREHGASYRAERVATELNSEFMRSSDPWFRPVRVTTGPDGAIWVVDMYRAVIEHPEWIPEAWQQQVDVRSGSDRGRIYRIVPKNRSLPARWPNLSDLSDVELIGLLEHDSGTLRDMAQQVLLERGDKSVALAVRVLLASRSLQARVQALWTLNGLGELQVEDLAIALSDEHPGVVRNAILLCEPRLSNRNQLPHVLAQLAHHPDAKVRLQLTLTLGKGELHFAGKALQKLASAIGDDPWLAQAIVCSSKHYSIQILDQALSDLRSSSEDSDATNRLVAMISDLVTTADKTGKNPSALVARSIAEADADAVWVFPLAAACTSGSSEAANGDPQVRRAVTAIYERAKRLAGDENASSALRCQALQLFATGLGGADEEQGFLSDLLTAQIPLEVQLAAVERLAQFRDAESTNHLLSRWPELSVAVRGAVAHRMLATAETVDVLISRLESGDILASDLSPAVRQSLRQSGSQSLQARINRVLGKTAAANQQLIEQYLRFQREDNSAADIHRGRELFKKNCAACHTPDEAGHASGPNLSNLTDRSPATLTEAILAPNRAVEPQYRSYVVVLNDGRALSGIIAAESGDALTLGLADGKRTTISRSEIDEFRNTGVSLMPDGMQQELDPAMLRDVVEYLRSDSFLQSESAEE